MFGGSEAAVEAFIQATVAEAVENELRDKPVQFGPSGNPLRDMVRETTRKTLFAAVEDRLQEVLEKRMQSVLRRSLETPAAAEIKEKHQKWLSSKSAKSPSTLATRSPIRPKITTAFDDAEVAAFPDIVTTPVAYDRVKGWTEVLDGAEPTSDSIPVECGTPTSQQLARRGFFSDSDIPGEASTGTLGLPRPRQPSVSRSRSVLVQESRDVQPPLRRPSSSPEYQKKLRRGLLRGIDVQDDVGVPRECATPTSRDLASASFSFDTPEEVPRAGRVKSRVRAFQE